MITKVYDYFEDRVHREVRAIAVAPRGLSIPSHVLFYYSAIVSVEIVDDDD